MSTGHFYDVPPIGEWLKLRGLKATVLLEKFAPTHLDAWYGKATTGDGTFPAVVVRQAGNVQARGLAFGKRDVPPPPAPDAVLGIVVEERGAAAVWLPAGDPAAHAVALSRAEWRTFTPPGSTPA